MGKRINFGTEDLFVVEYNFFPVQIKKKGNEFVVTLSFLLLYLGSD